MPEECAGQPALLSQTRGKGEVPHDDILLAEAAKTPARADVANRHKLMMLVATVARMGVGLLSFLILARFLGPLNFGMIATAIAYGGFISIVSDFGLGVSALRLASADPDNAATIVTQAMAAKGLLTCALSVASFAGMVIVLPTHDLGLYAMIWGGVFAYAFADLFMVAVRAQRRFDVEAILVVVTSIFILIVVGGVAVFTRDLQSTAAAFLLSRVVYLIASLIVVRRTLNVSVRFTSSFAEIRQTLRMSSGYALDSVLTVLSSQVDVLLFAGLISMHNIGVYQAGARLVQAILPFAVILSTVYMPILSATAIQGDIAGFRRNARPINMEFCVLAVIGGIGFAFVGPIVTKLIYGDSYAALNPLWTGFAVFVALRLAASSYGIQLAAMGFVKVRITASLVSILLFCMASLILVPRYGLAATSWMLALSGVPSFLILGGGLARDKRGDKSVLLTALIVGVEIVGLILFRS